VTKKAKAEGLGIHRAKRIKYSSVFGVVEMLSPYLWNKNTGRGARPVKEQLGIEHGDRWVAVQQAMCDFGSEESFEQAAKRFGEHYGWSIDQATVRREVEKTAVKAEQYVETRLWEAGWDYLQPLTTRFGIEQMLVELDGSHVRTGKKVTLLGAELTKKRRLPKSQRNTVRLSLKPDKLRVVVRGSSARMQLKEFSLISHTIEPGTVLKALETAIPWTAIEQAIGKAKAGEERKRALPSHLVVCLIITMSLWSKASMRTVLKNLVDGLSEAGVRVGKYWRVPMFIINYRSSTANRLSGDDSVVPSSSAPSGNS
jgi:hypothetical protein